MDQTVLITPLGWERDRASCLGQELRIHKAYLLYRTDHSENKYFADLVKNDLEDNGTEVIQVNLENNSEFESVLFNVSKIIVQEYAENNIIYVNMSASGKIAAAATTIASMFHREKIQSLIYVSAENYSVHHKDSGAYKKHGLAIGMSKRYSPPLFHIERPSDPILKTIIALYENGPMKYEKILTTLKEHEVPGYESFEYPSSHKYTRKKEISRWTARLRRNILNPVENLYIEITPSHEGPEKMVNLTREGEYLAILTGMVSSLKSAKSIS